MFSKESCTIHLPPLSVPWASMMTAGMTTKASGPKLPAGPTVLRRRVTPFRSYGPLKRWKPRTLEPRTYRAHSRRKHAIGRAPLVERTLLDGLTLLAGRTHFPGRMTIVHPATRTTAPLTRAGPTVTRLRRLPPRTGRTDDATFEAAHLLDGPTETATVAGRPPSPPVAGTRCPRPSRAHRTAQRCVD